MGRGLEDGGGSFGRARCVPVLLVGQGQWCFTISYRYVRLYSCHPISGHTLSCCLLAVLVGRIPYGDQELHPAIWQPLNDSGLQPTGSKQRSILPGHLHLQQCDTKHNMVRGFRILPVLRQAERAVAACIAAHGPLMPSMAVPAASPAGPRI